MSLQKQLQKVDDLYAPVITRREAILKRNRRRILIKGYLLAAMLALLAGMCGAILYVRSHPKAPTYSYEDRQALDHLIDSLR